MYAEESKTNTNANECELYENIILPNLTSQKYKELFRNAGTNCGPVTRRSCGPISCKGSQLIYIIIALLNTLNNNLDTVSPHQLLDIYNYVTRNRDISGFSLFNNPSNMLHIVINNQNINNIFIEHTEHIETIIYPMALVNATPFNNELGNYLNGVISHYFIIIKRTNNETNEPNYSILSSYGSDCVQVPQYETPLDLDYFSNVVEAFDSNELTEERNQILHNFLTEYFFKGGKITYYIDDYNPSRKRIKRFEPESGSELEEQIYYEPNKFKFYYFCTFVSKVHQQLLNYYKEISGGAIRKKMSKKRKLNKRKRLSKKKKLTKRN
jgi:hypothetical protein